MMKKKKNYPHKLHIDLKAGNETELFKWFLACLLFGKPIQRKVVLNTFLELEKAGLTSPQKIIDAGWDKLVETLDKGGYARFDYSTATKILAITNELLTRYGSIQNLLQQSSTLKDLSMRLQEFNGIGPITAKIFIRDIRKSFK